MVESMLIISGLGIIFIFFGIKIIAIIILALGILYYFFGFQLLFVIFLLIMLVVTVKIFIRIEKANK